MSVLWLLFLLHKTKKAIATIDTENNAKKNRIIIFFLRSLSTYISSADHISGY